MKTNMATSKGRAWLILLLTILFLGCVGPVQKLTPADMSITRPDAESIVIVHSRSGNTAQMGQLISEAMNADYIRLAVPEGAQESLLSAPQRNDEVEITPQKVDLSQYRLVFLGSPVWFWHPSAFIYTFIKNNDLAAKKVVLFYTYEGGLAEDAIEEWKGLVQQSGGTVIDVIGINRADYRTPDALASQANKLIDRQKSLWMGDRNQ